MPAGKQDGHLGVAISNRLRKCQEGPACGSDVLSTKEALPWMLKVSHARLLGWHRELGAGLQVRERHRAGSWCELLPAQGGRGAAEASPEEAPG